MRKILLPLMALVVLPAHASAQQTPASAQPKDIAAPIETTYLRITIEPSRSPIAMDTAAGLSAEIKNVSSVPVRLYENETMFITMPETRIYGGRQALTGCATFPTQGNTTQAQNGKAGQPADAAAAGAADARRMARPARGYELLMQPGDSYRVFWDMRANGCTNEPQVMVRFWHSPILYLEEKWQRIAFTPGTYKVYLDVVLYPGGTPEQYHTATEGREVEISASQQMVLLGAFLGGLLAYVIKLYYGVETPLDIKMKNRFLKDLIGYTEWLAAGLFAAGMVILASRLSDTFPVRVSASDFWGALTLGFVFQWLGVKLLEKLPGMSTTTKAS